MERSCARARRGQGRPPRLLVLSLVLLALTPVAAAPTPAADASESGFKLGGLLAGLGLARLDTSFAPFFSLRFIPEMTFSAPLGRGFTLDGEVSANAYASASLSSGRSAETSSDIKPYRGWVRLSTSRFEARVGLQKLSFGSAALFRPLMWFDSLDPRDPLQLTDGVYGVLLRAYAGRESNLWVWGLYGNEDPRGWDIARSDKKTPEFGGRIQMPLFKGEIAATVHRRRADLNPVARVPSDLPALPLVREDRYALDGKWDMGVGVWFEGSWTHQDTALLPRPWQRALTLGADYTIAVGNGLNVVAEQFRLASAASAFGRGEGMSFSALLVRYPLGLLDEVSGIVYYDWTNRRFYRFFSWKRTTNALTFSAIVYWNPKDLRVFPGREGSGSFAGTGLELLLAYNF